MSIIFNMSTLEKVLEEKKQMGRKLFLVQEFVNHNATIFKVFVLGKKTNIVRRVSLPNLATEDLNEASTIVFDSQEWKHQLPDKFITNITGKAEFPDQERISKISEALGNICVTLFLTSPSMTERSQFIFTKHDLQVTFFLCPHPCVTGRGFFFIFDHDLQVVIFFSSPTMVFTFFFFCSNFPCLDLTSLLM
eukprot:TRINITY_DN1067_c0_g1_i1.p1 TRINITY_DN1067_c0_g1~~TRINITY_DN1067_c0_g1_i1.p1  ORF type:complete len:192 (-),score=35.90 TRINITY_DN1067_c0_g1_i1:274-849(-)